MQNNKNPVFISKTVTQEDEALLASVSRKGVAHSLPRLKSTTAALIMCFLLILGNQVSCTSGNSETLDILSSLDDYDELTTFTMENGLKVLLINPKNGKTRASVVSGIGVGANSDPSSFMGFFHLTEHMLFNGSKKYPVANTIKNLA